MSTHDKGLKIYAKLLRLYPWDYREKYGEQLLQTVADMLDDAPSLSAKTGVLIRIAADLPISICTEHFLTIGDTMNTQNNQRIRLSTGVSAALLLVGMIPPLYNRTQIALGNFDGFMPPLLYRLVATLLPLLALLLSGVVLYALRGNSNRAFFRRAWPLLVIGGIALLYLLIVIFLLTNQRHP